METELKLQIDVGDIDKLRELPILKQLATEPPHIEEMVTTYFDTPNLWLHRHSAALRVREVDGTHHWTQTLKVAEKPNAGLHQRQEWESPVPTPNPNTKVLMPLMDAQKWKQALQAHGLSRKLQPVFSLHVKRSIWLLRLDAGDEIELGLDEGIIDCDGKQLPVHEVELELKSGEAAHLFDFALTLLESFSLHVEVHSKSDRGYALRTSDVESHPVKASSLRLSRRCSTEEGVQEIVRNCLAHILVNSQGIAGTQASECVHQTRVGIRRLRSAFKLFKDVVPVPQDIQDGIDLLGTQLGEARDWDVLASSTLPKVAASAPEDADIDAIQQLATERAKQKREQAAAAVDSPDYTRLMLRLSAWCEGAAWQRKAGLQYANALHTPLRKFAAKILKQDQKRLHKRGKRLHAVEPRARHRVRIAAKETRYATEFFHSLYPKKRVAPYVDALSELQDELGWMNDAAVANRLLSEFRHDEIATPEIICGAGFARGYLLSAIEAERSKLFKTWKHFRPLKAPSSK